MITYIKQELNDSFFNTHSKYCQPSDIIATPAFLQSLEILAKYDYNSQIQNIHFYNKKCEFCHSFFPASDTSKGQCSLCSNDYCIKHRQPLNHNCTRLSSDDEKYLLAKQIFREKLKLMKYKGSYHYKN